MCGKYIKYAHVRAVTLEPFTLSLKNGTKQKMIHPAEELATNIALNVLTFQFNNIEIVGDKLLKEPWSGKCQCLFPEVTLFLFRTGLSKESTS